MNCPKCGNVECHRDEADTGVGVIYGPWGCPNCAWSEDDTYDLSGGKSPVREDGVIDQYGGLHPKGGKVAVAVKQAEEVTILDDMPDGMPDMKVCNHCGANADVGATITHFPNCNDDYKKFLETDEGEK